MKALILKKSKKLHFLKGLYHGSRQKFESCSSFYFMQNRQGKLKIFHRFIFDKIDMCLPKFSIQKKLDNKKINLIKKTRKNCIFPKRLVHGFRQKFEICQFSVF